MSDALRGYLPLAVPVEDRDLHTRHERATTVIVKVVQVSTCALVLAGLYWAISTYSDPMKLWQWRSEQADQQSGGASARIWY